MNLGIEFEICWYDESVLEFQVLGSNGTFAGAAHIYGSHEEFNDLARLLRGFPTTSNDSREFETGNFDPKNGGGGLRISFSCIDSAGHIEAWVIIRKDAAGHERKSESVEFTLKLEAVGIDRFVESLERMQIEIGSKSALCGAT